MAEQSTVDGWRIRWRGRLRRRPDFAFYLVLFATIGLLLAGIALGLRRFFDPDEFEHAHAAWCVSRGMLPYRDFFEHHTPWYHYTLRPLFHWFDVAGRFQSAKHFLLFGRGLSLGLSIVSTVLVFQIGRLWKGRKTGAVAALFLVSQPVFLQKAIELRPDVLALPLFLGCVWFLLRRLVRPWDAVGNRLGSFLAAGLSLGAAIMCTQKMLFVLPGALAGLALWSLFRRRAGIEGHGWLLAVPVFALGVCVPVGLTWAAFAFQRGGAAFITHNFLLNANWKPVPTGQLRELILNSWPILVLCLLGVAISLLRFFRCPTRPCEGLLLLCILAGLFAGVPVLPSAHAQYYLIPLPLVCLFAAQGLLFLVERAARRPHPMLLVLALIPLGVLPARALRGSLEVSNEGQLARLRFVFESTRPVDVVLDGWAGTGVFRPHAFRHFFLHPEIVAMLPATARDGYLTALEHGQVRPALIAMDWNLAALGPRFLRFVRARYVSDDGVFYFRNGFFRPRYGDMTARLGARTTR